MNKQHNSTALEDLSCLKDILVSSESIQEITKDISFEAFDSDMMRHLSTARLFEIIGEATKKLSKELRKNYPHVPWKEMAGMRDILIHAYRNVDNQVIWSVAKKDIPGLAVNIQNIIGDVEKNTAK